MNTGPDRSQDRHAQLPDGLARGLRDLRADVPPPRDLWPGIVARLEPRTAGGRPAPRSPAVTAAPVAATGPAWRANRRRPAFALRNARYAGAAAVVLAAGIGWQLWPAAVAPTLPQAPDATVAMGPAAVADAPLLRAADALAREYQGALREVATGRQGLPADAGAGGPAAASGLDAELARRATEVRAALARDPDALHLLHRLQRIYAHRLALNLRQA